MRSRNTSTFYSVVIFLCSVLSPLVSAVAQVSVNSVVVTFTSRDRPVRNLVVSNSGVTPMFVTVRVELIKDLAAEQLGVVPAEDLLVSPKNFSVAPQGQRTIRLLLKSPPADKEQAYRVLLLPQYSEFGEEQVKAAKVGGRSLSLKVATGIGVLVYAQPREVVANLEVTRNEKEVTFSNKGNVHYTVSGGVACAPTVTLSDDERQLVYFDRNRSVFEAKGCTFVAGGRVHAGRSLAISAQPDKKLFIGKRVGSSGDFEPLVIEAVR